MAKFLFVLPLQNAIIVDEIDFLIIYRKTLTNTIWSSNFRHWRVHSTRVTGLTRKFIRNLSGNKYFVSDNYV